MSILIFILIKKIIADKQPSLALCPLQHLTEFPDFITNWSNTKIIFILEFEQTTNALLAIYLC